MRHRPSRQRNADTSGMVRFGREEVAACQTCSSTDPSLSNLGQYEFGWSDSDAAGATARRGINDEVVTDISDAQERAGVDAQEPPQGPQDLRHEADAHLGRRPVRHRLRQHQVLRPLHREAGRHLGGPARGHQEHLREARHPRGRAPAPRRRRRRPVRVRGGLPPDPRGPRGPGRHLHGHRHGAARASGDLQGVLRHRHPVRRQQVRRAQHGGLVGRLVRLRAAGRARRDPAAGLLPHQHREHGPVRAHADHRRRGLVRALHRGLHGADLQVATRCTRPSSRSS